MRETDIYSSDYRKAARVDAKFHARVDSIVLKSAAVVGMTTTGAAKYNTLLRTLKPEVIVFEEAAEVWEASIIASFMSETKHLIWLATIFSCARKYLSFQPQPTIACTV